MLYDLYVFDHNVLHICFWTLPLIILGVFMVIMAIVHKRNHNKREKEFNEQLEEKMNALTVESQQKEVRYMSYIIQHTCLGFCWLDLVALIILIAVIAVAFLRRRDMKKE